MTAAALTPGQRRQCAGWVAGAKQATTRARRADSMAIRLRFAMLTQNPGLFASLR
jgi:uncharacterized protein YdeI (YjbR/CyaY-like superfamily)